MRNDITINGHSLKQVIWSEKIEAQYLTSLIFTQHNT